MDGGVVKSWSSMQTTVAQSSGEAEYYAMVRAAAEALGLQSIMNDLGWPAGVRIWVDSSAAKSMSARIGLGRVRHMEVKFLWLQEVVKDKRVEGKKIPGACNPADALTKPKSYHEVAELLEDMGVRIVQRQPPLLRPLLRHATTGPNRGLRLGGDREPKPVVGPSRRVRPSTDGAHDHGQDAREDDCPEARDVGEARESDDHYAIMGPNRDPRMGEGRETKLMTCLPKTEENAEKKSEKEEPEKEPERRKPEKKPDVKPNKMPIMKPGMLSEPEKTTTTCHRGAEPRPQFRQGSGDETRGVPFDRYRYGDYYDATPWGRNEVYGPDAETHGARTTTITSMKSRILAWEWWGRGVRGVDRRRPGVRGRQDDLRV